MLNAMHYTQHGIVSDVVEKIRRVDVKANASLSKKNKKVDKLSKQICMIYLQQ